MILGQNKPSDSRISPYYYLREMGMKALLIVASIAAIIILIAGLLAGLGIIASLLMVVLVCIIIYFGSMVELAGSVVVGCVLKTFTAEIHSFAGIWWTTESAKKFFALIDSTGYFNLIAVIFFFAYAISFMTDRVNLFHVSMRTVTEKEKE